METPAIAIVGMACRYPDAASPAELWDNVLAQRRAFRRLPSERLRLEDYLPERSGESDSIGASQAAVLEDYHFDRARFRISGRTFQAVDMTHWLALDVAAEAFADGGFPGGEGLPGDATGVLVGNSLTGEFTRAGTLRLRWPYVCRQVDAALQQREWPAEDRADFLEDLRRAYQAPFPVPGDESLAGGLSNTIAGRICNYYDLHGGGYTVDGACASSLLAVATACSHLVAGDWDVALAGGVDLSLDPFELVGFSRLGALASGEMRVFDARPTGFWPGEGCGMVVLMRYEDAVRQHRRVYAVIRGWGISSDGSGGITRPEVRGQLLAVQRAYQRAGFEPGSVAYLEGHGTGTPVGDTTELQVLVQARLASPPLGPPAAVGSIKANIGHTKAAAGVAGLIKATLAVTRQVLPPTTGWETPHPVLAESGRVLRLLREGEPWPASQPLRAGVSAMGFGGINAHLVIESAAATRFAGVGPRERMLLTTPQDAELFAFRGADLPSLRRQVARVRAYAGRVSRAELADLAAALAGALEPGGFRAAVVASRPAELAERLDLLDSWLADGVTQRLDDRREVLLGSGQEAPAVGLLFPGQGSPVRLDGGLWARRFPLVRKLLQQAAVPAYGDAVPTQVAQPAIVAMSQAGLQILERLGIVGQAAVGHSLGELSAYHWAHALDGPALQRIAAARGRAMAEHGKPGGAMASLAADAATVQALLGESRVVLAGLNSPMQTVISGEADEVQAVMTRAQAAGVPAVRLPVSHAFHSPLVAPAVPALAQAIAREEFRPLQRRVFSTVTGQELGPGEDLRNLLVRQMTEPVRLMEAVQAAAGRIDLWIEVGPGTVLRGIASRLVPTPIVALDAGGDSLRGLLLAVGTAFVLGANVAWRELFADRFTKPFELEWQPSFLCNPCEAAPTGEVPAANATTTGEVVAARGSAASTGLFSPEANGGAGEDFAARSVTPALARAERENDRSLSVGQTGAMAAGSMETTLDFVRGLVAQRAELPLESVAASDRLLKDLHFNSLSIGQLVVEAARALGRMPPVSPTDTAQATVGEVAELLACLPTAAEADGAAEAFPPGVDSWVRAFAVELVERPLPARAPGLQTGLWRVLGPPDHPLRETLQQSFAGAAGGPGVVLLLPPEPDERQIELLLDAGRAALTQPASGRFVVVQHGGGGAAFARSVQAERSGIATCVVDVPPEHPQAAAWVLAEARACSGHVEAHYDDASVRREPRLRLLPLPNEVAALPLHADDVLLVTGGGKGIGAECVLALARRTGVRLGLLGRSQPSTDETLAANLQRFAAAGVRFHYCSADVTDAAGVRAAIQEVTSRLGPVTAVLHAAGFNHPQRLETLDRDAFLRTWRPKVEGARHVLDAVDPQRLRLLIAFGSIIARTGLQGQADYAVANEGLTRLVERWRQTHPHCRCLSAEFSVWSSVGMGERLGTIDALKQQGISPIPPDEGVGVLERLLAADEPVTAAVVAGRFGAPPTLKFDAAELPLLRFLERPRVYVPGVELVAEAELSADADPYVRDHVYQGVPLLPAVMGLEAMAQAASVLAASNELPVFEQVQFRQPIVVPERGSTVVRVAALVRAPGQVEVVLRSGETGFQVDHFRALCRWPAPRAEEDPAALPTALLDVEAEPPLPPVDLQPERDLYGSVLFHTGRFRRVRGYQSLSATGCVARIGTAEPAPWFSQHLSGQLLLGDPAARDAVIHAIQACIPHGTLLPTGVERLVIRRPLEGPVIVRARERSCDGDAFVYDVQVTGEDGRLLERWDGLQLRRVSHAVLPATWAPPLLGAYLERRLGELFPETPVSVAVETNGGGGRTARSERAIQLALRSCAPVGRRSDGKPEARGGRAVSATHAGDWTLAVSAVPAVACDAEAVAPRSDEIWQDLLRDDRYRLAELMAARLNEDRDTASTRVWAAAECLTKSGHGADTPLLFESRTEDGWAVLKAGTSRLAAWVAPVRGADRPLAIAVCLEDCRAGV
jgi:enediyne polyketide synthase